jgi:putative SOS response-associated peptidase YedK
VTLTRLTGSRAQASSPPLPLPCGKALHWRDLSRADGKTKQPYYITLNDQDIFGFAGRWDSSTRDDGVKVQSCTMVATPVSKRVNTPKNNDAELIAPVAAA